MFTKMLEAEIRWCEKNKESMPAEYRNGFIAGLKQAIYLINATRQRYMLLEDGTDNDIVLQDPFGLTLDEAKSGGAQVDRQEVERTTESENGK